MIYALVQCDAVIPVQLFGSGSRLIISQRQGEEDLNKLPSSHRQVIAVTWHWLGLLNAIPIPQWQGIVVTWHWLG